MKSDIIGRRDFLRHAAAITAGATLLGKPGFAQSRQKGAKLRKALQLGMLPRQLSDEDKFKLARKCGFNGIEGSPMGDLKAAQAAQAKFYPINPGHEGASWKRFYEEAADRFFDGQYSAEYEQTLIDEFQALMPDTPPWQR